MSDILRDLRAALEGRYRIDRELGAGGMATVYLAHDTRHDRKVALKILRPELSAAIGADRFLQEIKTTANLHHPHVLALFDSGEVDGTVTSVATIVDTERVEELPVRSLGGHLKTGPPRAWRPKPVPDRCCAKFRDRRRRPHV